MILFTGHGEIAKSYSAKYPCKIISCRNLTDVELRGLFSSCTAVIHNSANLSPQSLSDAVTDNFYLTRRLIDILNEINPAARFVYLSSMSILKNFKDYQNPFDMNYYSVSKYMGEIYTLLSPIPNKTSIRFSTIFYGNPQKDGLSFMINEAVHNNKVRIINNGSARRDFLPIDVLSDYLYQVVSVKKLLPIYTFSSGESLSFKDVLSIIKKELPDIDVIDSFADNIAEILSEFPQNNYEGISQIKFNISDYIKSYIDDLIYFKGINQQKKNA